MNLIITNEEGEIMKYKKLSVKWKIFLHMLCFMGILLLLLWLFQTVYLDTFYKKIKTSELEDALSHVEETSSEDDFSQAVDTIAESYDICILVTDLEGNMLYSSDQNMNCAIHKLPVTELVRLMEQAEDGDVIKIKNNLGLNFDKNRNDIQKFSDAKGNLNFDDITSVQNKDNN